MPSTIYTVTVDCHDHDLVATFWQKALGWEKVVVAEDEIVVHPPEQDGMPAILFAVGPDPKNVKNRWHLDLNPDDQASEVARLESLGAREVDIGQRGQENVTWVVMADPEGNEFCVLRAR